MGWRWVCCFMFGGFFCFSLDGCFQCSCHSEGPSLKKSLYSCSCFHNKVYDYIHKHCTCRVQVPCPLETHGTSKTRIGQRYQHFFLLLISINVGHVLQKACVKRQQQAHTFVTSSNYHFRAKSSPRPSRTQLLNVKKCQYTCSSSTQFLLHFFPHNFEIGKGVSLQECKWITNYLLSRRSKYQSG